MKHRRVLLAAKLSVVVVSNTFACFMPLAFIGSTYAQPLDIVVSNAQYATYVKANGGGERTTTSPSPFIDQIIATSPPIGGGAPSTNTAFANAGLFTVQDSTFGSALATATFQLWFSPLVDQTQTIGIQIGNDMNYTGGQCSLFDVTTSSYLWDYGWNFGGPVGGGTGIQWGGDSLNVDTSLRASDEYELTMFTSSSAASDAESPNIQLTGLEVIPEPATWALVSVGLSLSAALLFRHRKV
ncbi:MAG TPA: PEP-CTERM sorting domain-containing protein [Verrucomicrobiae bacterium]|nr:PEP-CTERM sorting domain-containing protein [Verrucomicrobiae bacterium]